MLRAGATLGRFHLRARVSSDGLAHVYDAYDRVLQRAVTLKAVEGDGLRVKATANSLLARAKAAATLSLPAVPTVLDTGRVADVTYVSTESVRGISLLERAQSEGFSLSDRVRALLVVSETLAAAHAQGVVHRALRHEHVVVTEVGLVKVLDFGVFSSEGIDRSATTNTLQPIPSNKAMSTERARLQSVGLATRDTDTDARAFVAIAVDVLQNAAERERDVVTHSLVSQLHEDGFNGMALLAARLREHGAELETKKRDRAVRRRIVALICVSLAAAAGYLAHPRLHGRAFEAQHGAVVSVSPPPSTPSTRFPPEALELQRAGLQALRDGARGPAVDNFASAARVAPSFAAAHLWWVIAYAYLDDESRRHLAIAIQSRATLSERDKAILEALEPWAAIPARGEETLQRLRVAVETYPQDIDVRYVLAHLLYLNVRDNEALQVEESALKEDPNHASLRQLKAVSLLRLGRTKEAGEELERCVAASPTATSCLLVIAKIDENEGRCVEAERVTRRLIALDPYASRWWEMRASELLASGTPREAVSLVLDQAALRRRGEDSAIRDAEFRTDLAIQFGEGDEGDRRSRDFLKSVDVLPNDSEHVGAVLIRAGFLIETGAPTTAMRIMNEYLNSNHAWVHDQFDVEQSFYVILLKYSLGALSREDFARIRDAWVSEELQKPSAERPLIWTWAFAAGALTKYEADLALSRLEGFGGIPDAMTRRQGSDFAIGQMYRAHGELSLASEFLRRSSRSCNLFQMPFIRLRATFALAEVLERLGDSEGACAAYGEVGKQWGHSAVPFTKATSAVKQLRALGCEESAARQAPK